MSFNGHSPTGVTMPHSIESLDLLESPNIFGLGVMDANEPFSDVTTGDLLPSGHEYGAEHDELQLSPIIESIDPSFFGHADTVPDIDLNSVLDDNDEADAAYIRQLQALETAPPQCASAVASDRAPAEVLSLPASLPSLELSIQNTKIEPKTEPMTVEESVPCVPDPRPRTGPGSRRKIKEQIRDDLDHVIYGLFPMDKLRLPREAFQEWRKTSGIRKLTVPEQRRLAKIRRMILARVYAERTRLRKIAETQESGETLSKVKAENSRLRKKVAKLEAVQSKVMEKLKRLMAQQKIHVE